MSNCHPLENVGRGSHGSETTSSGLKSKLFNLAM